MKFVDRHKGNRNQVSIIGQESKPDTWRLCKMNLAIRGISHNLGEKSASTFTEDLHKYRKVDYVMAIIWSQLTQRQSGSPFEAWMAHTKIA